MNLTDANIVPWLIPIPPLLAFLIIVLFTNRSRTVTHVVAIGGIVVSWLLSMGAVLNAVQFKALGINPPEGPGVFGSAIDWLVNGRGDAASGALRMGVLVDPLTTIMLFMVPTACLLIFIYSLGYMAHDPRNTRFFAFLSLFAGGMLILVVADNLLLLFIGWGIMGLCSYLLIGFWDEKPSAYQTAIKTFINTR